MTEDANTTQIATENAWPEGSPTVSMDASLARLGMRLDFDIEGYKTFLEQQGLGQEAQDLQVKFLDGKTSKGIDGEGVYYPSRKEINLHTGKYAQYLGLEPGRINNALLHETRHFEQYLKGLSVIKREKSQKRAIQFATALGSVVVMAVGMKYGGLATNNTELMALVTTTSVPTGFVGTKLGKEIGYRTSPAEKDANDFVESQKSTEFFKVT